MFDVVVCLRTVSVRATPVFAQRTKTPNPAYTSPRDISTTIDPIKAAIEYLDSLESGAAFSYTKVAEQFDTKRSTLSRRHQGISAPRKTQNLR